MCDTGCEPNPFPDAVQLLLKTEPSLGACCGLYFFGFHIPVKGSVAAGGLIETFSDIQENLDISDVFNKKDIFALTVNGDSMIDACIADGDMVLMEPIKDSSSIRNGTIVSAMVPGSGSTLKYYCRRNGKIFLEAANPAYEPIELNNLDEVVFQGKLLAVWRKV